MGVVKRVRIALEDYLRLPKMRKRDPETGREILDPVPIAPPIGWYKQPSMFDQVRDMVRSEHMRMYAAAQGHETFEEASDFNVEDDMFPSSQYEDENDFEPVENLQARRQAEYRRNWMEEREKRRQRREEAEWKAEDAAASSSSNASSSGARPAASAGKGDGPSETPQAQP